MTLLITNHGSRRELVVRPPSGIVALALVLAAAMPCLRLDAQSAPFNGPAAIVGAISGVPTVGSDFTVDVRVDLRGVTGQNGASTVPAVLGGYDISVSFDKTRVSYVSAGGGTTSQFSSTPTATGASTANANGAVSIVASQTDANAPTGLVSVARLTFTALVAGETTMDLDATSLSSAYQGPGAGPASIPDDPGTLAFTIGAAPGSVSYVQPENGATDLESPVTLEWSAASGATSYRVYFGLFSNPSLVTGTTSTFYTASVQQGNIYYWKIGAVNDWGQTDGPVWSFSTKPGTPPGPVSYIRPADGATDLESPVMLEWSAASGATSYKVYFGASSNPPQVRETTSTSYAATVEPGKTYYWKIGAANDWGQTDGFVWRFSTKACTALATPVLTLSRDAECGTEYVVSWAGVPSSTSYEIQESLTSDFSAASTEKTAKTSFVVQHVVCELTSYHYRVRAMSQGEFCDVESGWSTTQSVLVHPAGVELLPTKKHPVRRPGSSGLVDPSGVEPAPASTLAVVPFVGSAIGYDNTRLRTAAQLHNPSELPISGRLTFHPNGKPGSASDPFEIYALWPNQTLDFPDVVATIHGSGPGSLDITADVGDLPLATFRIFIDAGAEGTNGLTEEPLTADQALHAGEEGVLIATADRNVARFDIGIRTLSDGAVLTATVFDSDGVVVGTVTKAFAPDYCVQGPAVDLLGLDPPDGGSIRFLVDSGTVFIYGVTTDNLTQDPSLQMVRPVP